MFAKFQENMIIIIHSIFKKVKKLHNLATFRFPCIHSLNV